MALFLPLGTNFDKGLRSVALVGEHSNSQVFLALNRDGGTHAVKVLRPEVFSPEALEAYAEDAACEEEGIVGAQVRYLGEVPYAFRKHVAGTSLENLLVKDALFHSDLARDIVHAVVAPLRILHRKNRAHGAIKPGNLILRSVGGRIDVVIVDIGTHHLEPPRPQDDATIVFTDSAVEYRGPELRSGEKATVRADLFSVGVLLYRMLAGRVPFPGGIHYTNNCTPLRDIAPRAAPDLLELAERLLRLREHETTTITAEGVWLETKRLEKTSGFSAEDSLTRISDEDDPISEWTEPPAEEEEEVKDSSSPWPSERGFLLLVAITVTIIGMIIAAYTMG